MYPVLQATIGEFFLKNSSPKRIAVQISRNIHLANSYARFISESLPKNNTRVFVIPRICCCCVAYNTAQNYQAEAIIAIGPSCLCGELVNPPVLCLPGFLDGEELTWSPCDSPIKDNNTTVLILLENENFLSSEIRDLADENVLLCTKSTTNRLELLGSSEHVDQWIQNHESTELRLVFIGDKSSYILEEAINRYYSKINGDVEICGNKNIHFNSISVRRYRLIEQVKKARRIALVFAEHLNSGQNELRNKLKNICRDRDRVVIQITVDPISVCKLNNFPNVEAFCYISCASKTIDLVRNDKEYQRVPVITPYELLVAMGCVEWTVDWPIYQNGDDFTFLNHIETDDEESTSALCTTTLAVTGSQGLVPVSQHTFQGVESNNWNHNPLRKGLQGIPTSGYKTRKHLTTGPRDI